ncbi:hypothetical protein ABFS83_08G217300 [Erythranthe nasuta]
MVEKYGGKKSHIPYLLHHYKDFPICVTYGVILRYMGTSLQHCGFGGFVECLGNSLSEKATTGCEVGLARKFTKSILSGKSHLLLKNENHDNRKSTKQTKSPDIFLPGRS